MSELRPGKPVEQSKSENTKSVIVKKNGRVLHSGSLESCQFFVEMLELKGQVDIK